MMRILLCLYLLASLGQVANAALRGASRQSGNDHPRGNRRLAVATEIAIIGGVTDTTAKVGFRTSSSAQVKIRYATMMGLNNFMETSAVTTDAADDYTGFIELEGLGVNTQYWYKVVVDDVVYDPPNSIVQKFSTFPTPGSSTPVRFSVFTDAAPWVNGRAAPAYSSGSSNPNKDGALFAMQIGDFDHSDPMTLADLRLMHRELRSPTTGSGGFDFAANVLSKMPLVHMWDDHDYCGNDSDRTCPHKADSMKAYDEFYPGYSRPNPTNGLWHSFTAGRAEIFMLDLRYQRDPDYLPDSVTKSMLDGDDLGSTGQKQWLKDSLLASTAEWLIIVSTVTTNYAARPNNYDHWWTSFKNEATEMKDFIIDNGLESKTVIISGDLHTGGGIDNGCISSWGVPEMSVAHTNLVNGNSGAVGEWSEGVTLGSGNPGYGSVLVEEGKLTLESKDEDGNVVHSLVLPAGLGQPCAPYVPPGLQSCSMNLAHFETPSEGRCADVLQGNEYNPPAFEDDSQVEIPNDKKWYVCQSSGLRILRSNDIPEHYAKIANPNKPCEINVHAQFPLYPEAMANNAKFETDNIVGFAVNGVLAFNALEEASANAVEPDVGGVQDAQYWYGHPTARNAWHYHSPALGINDSVDVNTALTEDDFLGMAMDGFPIYGPVDDPDNMLDVCNFNITTGRYHIRRKDQVDESLPYCKDPSDPDLEAINWNYIIGCFRGDLTDSRLLDSTAETLPSDCQEVDPTVPSEYFPTPP